MGKTQQYTAAGVPPQYANTPSAYWSEWLVPTLFSKVCAHVCRSWQLFVVAAAAAEPPHDPTHLLPRAPAQLQHSLAHEARVTAAELLAHLQRHMLPHDAQLVEAALQEADHRRQGYMDAETLDLALSGELLHNPRAGAALAHQPPCGKTHS